MKCQTPTTVWQGKYLKVLTRGTWEYVQRRSVTGIVGIIPVTQDGRLVLVQQYRPPLDADVLELPAGLVGDIPGQEDEALETAARRELLEETGYEAIEMNRLFCGVASAGLSDEQMTLFLATDLRKVAAGGGDHTEDITVHEVSVDEVWQWLEERRQEGILADLKVYAALPFAASVASGKGV